jgi:hypothetical protein
MTGRELELDQLINLFIHAKERVSLYWGFYITLLTFIVGGIISKDPTSQQLDDYLKLFIILVFAFFALLNWDALRLSYRFLNIIGDKLGKVIEHDLSQRLKFALQFPKAKYLLVCHIFLDTLFAVSIWQKL